VIRILYDHQLFSRQAAGGASRYFYELLRYLGGVSQVQAELLLGIESSVYPLRQLASANLRVTSFKGPALPGIWLYVANEAFSNGLGMFRGKVDLYHPTLYRTLPMLRARRMVATHHDCTQERYPQEFQYAGKVTKAKQEQYARADAIICVSEWCRKEMLEFYPVDPSKTRVIHHGLSRLPRSAEAARQLLRSLRRDYVLYVGSRTRYKNFQGLLTAFRESGLHESFDLLALGGGPLTTAESNASTKLEITDSVICLPLVSDELLAEAYAGAKLFVYPSLSEGFGFPPLEAMSADCPVLASRVSSIPEVCRDAPFYFDPADQDCFQRGLLRAINDEDARKQAIERGREVAAQYSWERCGRETLALYRECQ
jgi:glycosyltransferase involved in cell wall biosynthesis